MALSTQAHGGGIPLDEFTATIPPGWNPAQRASYPLKTYLEKMKLWYRQTSLTTMSQIGPICAGRLKGTAYNVAVHLSVPLQNGTVVHGDEALAQDEQPAVLDPQSGAQVHPRIPSGLSCLLTKLREAYGIEDAD